MKLVKYIAENLEFKEAVEIVFITVLITVTTVVVLTPMEGEGYAAAAYFSVSGKVLAVTWP